MIFSLGFGIALLAYLTGWLIEFAFAGTLMLPNHIQAALTACEYAFRFGLVLMACSTAMYLSARLP